MYSVILLLGVLGQAADTTTSTQETLGPLTRVWLQSNQCWADGYQITGNSPYVGQWRIQTYYSSQSQTVTNQTTTVSHQSATQTYGSDPYGFLAILNNFRASLGLSPVAHDSNLSAWASQNNSAQSSRGLGHHVNPGCFQNSGWNYSDATSLFHGWLNSPGHRSAMLQPNVRSAGISYGPGPYWTLNLR